MRNIKIVFALLLMISFVHMGSAQHNSKQIAERRKLTKTKVTKTVLVSKKSPQKTVVVRTLPKTRTTVTHKGVQYYYANSKYYKHNSGRYTAVRPALGLRIKVLPTNYRRVTHQNNIYYFHSGVYYAERNNEYEIVNPDIGTLLYELPEDYEEVNIDGLVYLESNDVLYEKVQVDGMRAYEVVGFLED